MPSQRSKWFTSSYSGQNGECVEARRIPTGLDIRDSTRPQGPTLTVGAPAWSALLTYTKSRPLPCE